MKALTNILNYMLLLLMILIASCTEDAAEVDNLVRGEEYVTVRMQVPGMKNATTRADEPAEDNLTSVWALVFRNGKLQSKTEVTTESTLIPSTSTTGTFKLSRPKVGDVIHFLGNVPSDCDLTGVDEESDLTSLTTNDFINLSYWGMTTYTGGDINVTLYRNMAKVEILPDPDGECTFREDELFIAGLVKPNGEGTLVPCKDGVIGYQTATNHDLPTIDNRYNNELPTPLKSLYIFERENTGTADGFYIICQVGGDYYKVALVDEDKEKEPYSIIRNHRYVIYVKDLDEGYDDFDTAAKPETQPVNFKVKVIQNATLTVADNPTVYMNGGAGSTLPVGLTVPDGSELTQLQITAPNFTIKQGDSQLTQDENGVYSFSGTMEGVTTNYTFIPNSGLTAETYTITFKGTGNYLNALERTISVKVDASMMSVSPATATINMDENANASATLTLTKPGNVSNVNVAQSADVFNVTNTGDDYTFTPKNSTIAAGEYTITFSDASYPQVNAMATITVVNTPTVAFTNTGSQSIKLNESHTVTMTVPEGKTLSDFSITVSPATGLDVAQDGNKLTLTGGEYSATSGVSRDHTFTFTPSATGTYTVTFSGSGEGVEMSDETLTLEVSAAAATTMSVTAVDGDSTIDMDNGDTYVTLRLTKPTSQNSVKITFDANTFIINDDTNTSNEKWINNNSNETVDVKIALRNNDVVAGDYTITFTSGDNQMTATATITIKKTPTVSFSNTKDQILYWNNGSPTSFNVEMTGVPEGGSVSLNIANASAFTITLPDGTTVSDTYTGGNTIFTITPASANSVSENAYTITFTDADNSDGVNVPSTPIMVTVEDEKPAGGTEKVIWQTGNSAFNINEGYILCNGGGNIGDYQAGATVKVEFNYNINQDWEKEQMNLTLGTPAGGIYASESYEDGKTSDILTYTIQNGDVVANENGWANNIYYSGLRLSGSYVTITKISIIPAP